MEQAQDTSQHDNGVIFREIAKHMGKTSAAKLEQPCLGEVWWFCEEKDVQKLSLDENIKYESPFLEYLGCSGKLQNLIRNPSVRW